MSFPVVLSSTSQVFDTPEDDPHNVVMPATVNADDILMVLFTGESGSGFSPVVTTPSGWTKILERQQSGQNAHLCLLAKIADGTEDGASVNFPTTPGTSNITCTCIITRIQAGTYFSDVIANVLVAAGADQSSGEPDPPSLNPSWTATDDTLWGACTGTGDTGKTITGWPSNYTANQVQATSVGGAFFGTSIGQALRALAADSENPGTFTEGSNEYVTITWALRGIAAAGRTAKNTRANPLGIEIGMGWRMDL